MRASTFIFPFSFSFLAAAVGCGSDDGPSAADGSSAPPSAGVPAEGAHAPPSSAPPDATAKPPTMPPNEPGASALQCTPGPIAVHANLPKYARLFQCAKPQLAITDLAITGGHVYAASSTGHILRVVPAGGMPELVAYDPTPGVQIDRMIATTAGIAYSVRRHTATTASELRLIPVGQPGPVTIASFGSTRAIRGIADGPSEIFVTLLTDFVARTGEVVAIDKATFQSRVVAQAVTDPSEIIADATHVYFDVRDVGVVRTPIAGGAPQTVLAATSGNVGPLMLDDSSVIALARGTWPEFDDGKFLRAPKSGGPPVAFGVVRGAPYRPLLDGADVLVGGRVLPSTGDPGSQRRPLRYAPDGTVTELVPPYLAYDTADAIAADATSFYFGFMGSLSRLLR